MHTHAEGGTASHALYKGDLENPEEASLFRSKMTPNILSPAHRQLPAKAKSRTTVAATLPAADSSIPPPNAPSEGCTAAAAMPPFGVKIKEVGTEVEPSNRSPEP